MDNNKIAIETYEVIAKKYAQRYYDDMSQELPYIDEFLSHLPHGGKILDIGCGAGNYTAYMSRYRYAVIGLDLSEEMLKIARKKNPIIKFEKGDMRYLRFSDESFHGLLSIYSLIHIPTPEIPSVLKNFFRILISGGYLLLVVQAGQADMVVDEPMQAGRKMFFNFFSAERVTEFLNQAGFITVRQERIPNDDADTDLLSREIIVTLATKPF